jgi:hypothetical protein
VEIHVLGLKKNAARSLTWLAFACGLVGLWARPAYADAAVLLLESSPEPSGFFIALQIQLSGLATATRHRRERSRSAAEAIERGTELVHARRALAAVWIERASASSPAIVYVVGDRQGRALVEVVQVPGNRGPDLDRAAALKVRELVADMQRARAAVPEATQLVQAAPAHPPPAEPPPAPPQAAQSSPPLSPWAAAAVPTAAEDQPEYELEPKPIWAAAAFAGLRLGSQPAFGLARWGVGLGAGPVLDLQTVRAAFGFGFDAFPSVSVDGAEGRVRFWEWAASATFHAQLRTGPFWLGGLAGPQLVGVHATGVTFEQNKGSATPTSWALSLGADLELPLTGSVSLIASLRLQALANRLHLDVNAESLVDFGRLRAHIGADLLARF